MSGVSLAHLEVGEVEDDNPPQFAGIQTADVTKLYPNTEGNGAQILWYQKSDGWGVVRLPGVAAKPFGITVVNRSGETIPTGGAMRIAGVEETSKFGSYTFLAQKPDKNSQHNVLPLLGQPLEPGKTRWQPLNPIHCFRLETGEEQPPVQPGDFVGTSQDTWMLKKGHFGFLALGTQEDPDGQAYVYGVYSGLPPLLKATADEENKKIKVQSVDSDNHTHPPEITLAVLPKDP